MLLYVLRTSTKFEVRFTRKLSHFLPLRPCDIDLSPFDFKFSALVTRVIGQLFITFDLFIAFRS